MIDLYCLLAGLPRGLCADRERHDLHPHESETLGLFRCTGDPDDREPYRSERRRTAAAAATSVS